MPRTVSDADLKLLAKLRVSQLSPFDIAIAAMIRALADGDFNRISVGQSIEALSPLGKGGKQEVREVAGKIAGVLGGWG